MRHIKVVCCASFSHHKVKWNSNSFIIENLEALILHLIILHSFNSAQSNNGIELGAVDALLVESVVDHVAINSVLIFSFVLVVLSYLEIASLMVWLKLVHTVWVFKGQWQGFNLLRVVDKHLNSSLLGKIIDPAFEKSSVLVFFALRDDCQKLLESDLVDKLFVVFESCDSFEPSETWESGLRILDILVQN